MARKKQTARKSTRKGKQPQEVTVRIRCSDCQWIVFTPRDKAQDEMNFHYQQCQGLAPVRQVEDSEDEVVQQPITNNWIDCKECFFRTNNQDMFDLHYQQVHDPAPVRQVKDTDVELGYYQSLVWCQECNFYTTTQDQLDLHC